ncbi:MAG: NAD(+) diphosphatase [Caldilineaceae bacterium]
MATETTQFHATVQPLAVAGAPTLWYLFQGNRLIVRTTSQGQADHTLTLLRETGETPPAGLTPVRTQYVGWLEADGAVIHCIAGEIPEDAALPAGMDARGLRDLFGTFDDATLMLAGRAVQIVDWDRNHQFCGRCATPTEPSTTERVRTCPACGLSSYPRISPAIIIAVTRQTDAGPRILLARNHRFPTGRYSVIAGFVEPGESLEECCRREVREEVGIEIRDIRYFGSQPWPFPNSLMLGFTAAYASGDLVLEAAEIADAQWFAPDTLPLLPPKISIARQLIDAFVAENAG